VIFKKKWKLKKDPQCERDCESPISDMLDLLNVCSVIILSICSTAEEMEFYTCVDTPYCMCAISVFYIYLHLHSQPVPPSR